MAIHDDAIVAYLGDLPYKTQWLDHQSNARHGSLVGGAAWQTDAATIKRPYVSCLTRNTHYAEAIYSPAVALSEFSVACWFRLASAENGLQTIMFGGPHSVPWSLGNWWLHANVNITQGHIASISFRSSSEQTIRTEQLPLNTWIAAGASRASGGATKLYINGAHLASGTMSTVPNMGGLLVAGNNNAVYAAAADIADASVWARILTAAEFATLANPSYRPLAPVAATPRILSPYLIGDVG